MAHILECTHGHRWEGQQPGIPLGESVGRCPVCGAPGVVPVSAGDATQPLATVSGADSSIHEQPTLNTLNTAPEETMPGMTGASKKARLGSPAEETVQIAPGDADGRRAKPNAPTLVAGLRSSVPAAEGTLALEPKPAGAPKTTSDASDATALVEPESPAASRPPSQLEPTAFIPPKSRSEIGREASDETALLEPEAPKPGRPASQLEPTTFIAPPSRPVIGSDSGETTELPPSAPGRPASHLETTQFSPPPTVRDKKSDQLEQTTLFTPASTQRPPQQEETAFLTGESGPAEHPADPSATAVLESTSAPSAAEATANFQSDFDTTAAGDSAATGTFGETSGTADTVDEKAQRPKSRARLGLKEISGYEIISELGRGGMGVVYKARQKGIGRLVALKRILSNDISQNDIVRFRIEAEAVGAIQHPNIVQIYEMGEDNGKPWCALEYLDGGSLHGKLKGEPQPVRKIAETLEPLCRALDACHKKGIIHRDIKPANVLLASDGMPKLTDFGLAKKLDDDVGQTRSGTILGTPSYMAPEQAEGKVKEIGPAADIYSVGAMMYEMITGRPPLKGETVIDTLLLVQSTDPVSPSMLVPKVPRDLETICMKCLDKNPAKRYASAGDLAEDLRRFLDGEPISARPATPREKAIKWVRKNPKTAIGLAALVTIVVVSLGASVAVAEANRREAAAEAHRRALAEDNEKLALQTADAEAQKAESERKRRELAVESAIVIAKEKDRAEGNYNVARMAVDEILTRVAQQRLAHQPHMEKIRRELLQSALQFYEWLRGYKGDDPGLRWETGRAYVRVGDIREALGERAEAEKSYRTAEEYLTGLIKQFPDNPLYQRELANCLTNLGNLLKRFNDSTAARTVLERAAEIRQKLDKWHQAAAPFGLPASLVGVGFLSQGPLAEVVSAAIPQDDPGLTFELGQSFNNLGVLAFGLNQLKEADGFFQKALEVYERLAARYPKVEAYRFEQAKAFENLGELLAKLGKQKEAKTALENARENLLQLVEATPKGETPAPEYRQELAKCYDHLGTLLRDTDPARAQKLFQNSLASRTKLVEDFPDMLDYRQEMATSLNNMAIAWLAAGDVDRANQMFSEALQAQERLVGLAPLDRGFRSDLAGSYVNAGMLLHQKNALKDAEKYYLESLKHLDQLIKLAPNVPDYLRNTAAVLENIAVLQLTLNQPNEGLKSAQRSLSLREQLAKNWPQVPGYQQEVARSNGFMGTLLRQLGKPTEAEKPYRRALEILSQLESKYKNIPDYSMELALTYNNLADLLKTPEAVGLAKPSADRLAEAEKTWKQAIDKLAKLAQKYPTVPVYQKEQARSEAALAQFLDANARSTQAEQHWQQALTILAGLRNNFPDQPAYTLDLAQTLGKRGFAYSMINRFQRAQECLFQAIEILEPLALANPRVPEYWTELFLDYENLARSLKLLDLLQDTENIRKHMVALREKQLAAFPGNADIQCSLAGNVTDLAAILAQRGKRVEAEKMYQKAINELRGVIAKKPRPAECAARLTLAYVGLADTQLELSNHAEAALSMTELANLAPPGAVESVRIAGVLARCADVAAADDALPAPTRQDLSRRYADRAMESLRNAVSNGYRDLDYLNKAVALAPLRSRADFQQLVGELQGR